MSIRTFNGRWLLVNGALASSDNCCCDNEPCSGPCDDESPCPDGCYCCEGVCQKDPCVLGACCADDGTCSQTTENDCTGEWHAGISCDDIDCSSGCCETVTSPNGNCTYTRCRRGEKADCGSPCDPSDPQPQEPVTDCDGGTPSQVTVTGAGYVNVNTGDPALDAAAEAAANDSYVLALSCAASGSEQFIVGSLFVNVAVGVSSTRVASIGVYLTSPLTLLASMTLVAAAESPTTTSCGSAFYPCSDYSGAVTSWGGAGDGSAATIDVQGM